MREHEAAVGLNRTPSPDASLHNLQTFIQLTEAIRDSRCLSAKHSAGGGHSTGHMTGHSAFLAAHLKHYGLNDGSCCRGILEPCARPVPLFQQSSSHLNAHALAADCLVRSDSFVGLRLQALQSCVIAEVNLSPLVPTCRGECPLSTPIRVPATFHTSFRQRIEFILASAWPNESGSLHSSLEPLEGMKLFCAEVCRNSFACPFVRRTVESALATHSTAARGALQCIESAAEVADSI